jgi:hypothetical protein
MRRGTIRSSIRWAAAFVNVTLHSCSLARADASLDDAAVYQSERSHSEGRSPQLTMTRRGRRNVIDIWRSVLDSGATVAPISLILGSIIIRDRSQRSSQPRRPFEELLLEHCERILASDRSQELIVQLELKIEGICPAMHETTVLRVADELLSNAMEHRFYRRLRGHVFVHLVSRAGVGVQVSVSDDGWGFDSGPIIDGNGFHLLRQIGDLYVEAAAGPCVAKTAVGVVILLWCCPAATPSGSRRGARRGGTFGRSTKLTASIWCGRSEPVRMSPSLS